MATYQSTNVSASKPTVTYGLGGTLKAMTVTVATTAALTTADTLQFFTIPKNAKIISYKIGATQVDTNGSPTLAFNVGDAGLATRLYAGVAVGRTAGGSYIGDTGTGATFAGVGYQYPADTLITAVPSANAATGVAGSVTLSVLYTLEGGAS